MSDRTNEDNLVTIHEAINETQAEMIKDLLESEGIRVYVEQTPSPLDGLTVINEGTEVQVYGRDADRASAIVESFLAERRNGE